MIRGMCSVRNNQNQLLKENPTIPLFYSNCVGKRAPTNSGNLERSSLVTFSQLNSSRSGVWLDSLLGVDFGCCEPNTFLESYAWLALFFSCLSLGFFDISKTILN